MTETSKWNPIKSLVYGALAGVSLTILSGITGEHIGSNSSEVMGSLLGASIGGAALFGIVAVIRNALTGTTKL
jgi:hypothetical protein